MSAGSAPLPFRSRISRYTFIRILGSASWRRRIFFRQHSGTGQAKLAVFGREYRIFRESWTLSDVNVRQSVSFGRLHPERASRLVIRGALVE